MNVREITVTVLSGVIVEGRSLNAALDLSLKDPLSPRDRALVQSLSYGVLRLFDRLDALLDRLTRKPIRSPEVRLLALLGFYQIGYTRTPPHAAVSETVKACRKELWAKPLLNALLRTYQRQRDSLESQLDEAAVSRFSHPLWMIDRLQQDWPKVFEAVLLENNHHPPLTLRVNEKRRGREEILNQLRSLDIAAREVPDCPSAIQLDVPCALEAIPAFQAGEVSVQDAAAQLAAGFLAPPKGARVLDLCAAPGGKSCHLLEAYPEMAELVAVDIDPQRLERIRANLQRLDLSATLLVGDALHPASWWDGRPFDRILVDAPCSATGVIRRHPDIKRHRTPQDLEKLAELQYRILTKAFGLLAPGGQLLYATCSVFKAENEAVIGRFLTDHPEAVEQSLTFPDAHRGRHGIQILPGSRDMDGFFYARMARCDP